MAVALPRPETIIYKQVLLVYLAQVYAVHTYRHHVICKVIRNNDALTTIFHIDVNLSQRRLHRTAVGINVHQIEYSVVDKY